MCSHLQHNCLHLCMPSTALCCPLLPCPALCCTVLFTTVQPPAASRSMQEEVLLHIRGKEEAQRLREEAHHLEELESRQQWLEHQQVRGSSGGCGSEFSDAATHVTCHHMHQPSWPLTMEPCVDVGGSVRVLIPIPMPPSVTVTITVTWFKLCLNTP